MKPFNPSLKRRKFIKYCSIGSLGAVGGIMPISRMANKYNDKQFGVAILGLGNYATSKILPAFSYSKNCKLTGVISGTPEKISSWKEKQNLKPQNCYNYKNFDSIVDNPEIDIVYVATPNALHSEFTIRAAKAGKHVICEKPMEVSVDKCKLMIEACQHNEVLLQIGYRCLYDPVHIEIMKVGTSNSLGNINFINSEFSFYGLNGKNWRFTDKSLSGGGPLMDIGIYCLEAARYTTGEEPLSVTAQSFKRYKNKLPGMEETLFWQMEFPSGASANCSTSYVGRADYFHVQAENGKFGIEPAFGYAEPKGFVGGESLDIEYRNQQAAQMDAFAENINNGTPVLASGENGMQDMKIITAIYQAMQTGEKIKIS